MAEEALSFRQPPVFALVPLLQNLCSCHFLLLAQQALQQALQLALGDRGPAEERLHILRDIRHDIRHEADQEGLLR